MPESTEARFAGDPIHARLDECDELLDALLARDPGSSDTTGEVPHLLDSVQAILGHVRTALSVHDPRLVTPSMLSQMREPTNQLVAALGVASEDLSDSTADACRTAAEGLLDSICVLPLCTGPRFEESAARLLRSFRGTEAHARKAFAAEVQSASAAVQAERDEAIAAAQDAKKAADESTSTIETAKTGALGDTAAALEQLKVTEAVFETKVAAFEKRSTDAVEDQVAALRALDTKFEDAETLRKAAAADAVKDGRGTVDVLLAEIAETAQKADEVLQLAGGAALATRWIKQARAQTIERILWLAALLAFVVGSLVFAFMERDALTAPEGSSATDAVIFYVPRIPLAIITIVAVGFMLQQAGRRALWEARDRRVANELTAFPALIKTLEREITKDLVEHVLQKYLPGPDVSHDEPRHEERNSIASISSGFYALLGSLSTAAVVLGAALVIALTK